MLQYIVNNFSRSSSDYPVMHLYANSYSPSYGDGTSNYSEPLGWPGYQAQTLLGPSWTVAISGGITTASYAEQIFTFATCISIYGYFVTDSSDSILWAEEFEGAPFNLPATGGQIAITPKLSLQ
jgi:hypothetical protein